MLGAVLYIVAGLGLLALGAEGLVRGSTSVALRMGVTPLVIGLTIVAFGTGTPELLVSIQAAATGNSGIALGNIVGSNISNIGLILGCAALARPMRVHSTLLRREVPVMIGVTLLLCVMLRDGVLDRLEGAMLLAGSIVYTVVAYRMARKDPDPVVADEFAAVSKPMTASRWRDVGLIVLGLIALIGGASMLVKGATFVAQAFGLSQVVIGLTVVAIGTSMPELATSVVASLRNEPDVAFGNVLGSNILNILCVLGVVALIHPIPVGALSAIDRWVLAGSAMLVLPLMWRGAVLNRWEGALLVGGYIAYVAWLLKG